MISQPGFRLAVDQCSSTGGERTVRRKRYCPPDIERAAADLSVAGPCLRRGLAANRPEQRQHRLEQERRMRAVVAATQPAAVSVER